MTIPNVAKTVSFFDPDTNLWVELVDGKIPPALIAEPHLFMVEHDAPGRVMINLTAYVQLLIARRHTL